MKLFPVLFTAVLAIACSNPELVKDSSSNAFGLDTATNIYTVTGTDSFMNAAISQAKKTLEQLNKALNSRNSSYTSFAVKKQFNTPGGDAEHLWIEIIDWESHYYKGIVDNEPEEIKEVQLGDTVIVKTEEVTDWMYLDKNVLRGGYTIRAVLDRMSAEERKKMIQELEFVIED